MQKIRNYCLKYGKLIQSVMIMGICLILLFYSAFAWLSNSGSVAAKSNNLTVADVDQLKIAKTSGGKDIAKFIDTEQQLVVSFENDNKVLYPGESGSFKVYLTASIGNTFTMHSESIPGGIDTDQNSVSSFREDVDSTKTQNAQEYLKGHILFFLTKNNNVYSNWVDYDSGIPLVLNKNEEKEITVYWIWIDTYKKLTEDSSVIASDDLSKIRLHYFGTGPLDYTQEATENLFDFRGFTGTVDNSWLLHFYDFADEDIGRAIANIHFQLKFKI